MLWTSRARLVSGWIVSDFIFVSKKEIKRGWSGDSKYCVTTADGSEYLLRITPAAKASRVEEIFELQKSLVDLGVNMPRPLEYDSCDGGVHSLYTWVEGEDADNVLPLLSESQQYAYGLESGRQLKLIHSLPAPCDLPDWQTRFGAKSDRKIELYRSCPIQFDGAEHLISYIESNRHLLADRPQCFQHGDYHHKNMMIEDGKLIIIDFDRYDYGDPWEEFNRIVWSAQTVPAFASGQVDGYYEHGVPFEFWQLLAFYISSNTLSAVAWAIPFGEDQVQVMLDQAEDVLGWYDSMKNVMPTWYRGG